eukprot:926828_1
MYWKFGFLFLLGSNGALWIMKDLFFAPLVILPVVISVISLDPFTSHNFPLLGIIMANLLHLDNYNDNSKVLAFYLQYKCVIPIASFCLLFVKRVVFSEWKYMIDYCVENI